MSWAASGSSAEALAADATERQRREVERQQRAKNFLAPRRFKLKPGEMADIIILDHDIGPRINEHKRWDSIKKREYFETCPGDWEVCPLCEGQVANFDSRTYVMLLTVMDLRPYTTKDGRVIPQTRKLMAVKFDQIDKYLRMKDNPQIGRGSLRGIHLLMTRSQSQTSGTNGEPEFKAKYTEEDIMASFSHAEVRNDKGEVIKQVNEDCFPLNYGVIFPKPSADAIRSVYGIAAQPGSPRAGQGPAQAAGQGQQIQPSQQSQPQNQSQSQQSDWGAHNPGEGQLVQPTQGYQAQAPAPVAQERPRGIVRHAPVSVDSDEGDSADDLPV